MELKEKIARKLLDMHNKHTDESFKENPDVFTGILSTNPKYQHLLSWEGENDVYKSQLLETADEVLKIIRDSLERFKMKEKD